MDSQNEDVSDNLDSKRKIFSMKLDERDQQRKNKVLEDRRSKGILKTEKEASSFLLHKFDEEFAKLDTQLSIESSSFTENSDLIQHFDDLMESHMKIQKFFNESYTNLPSYNVRQIQNKLEIIKTKISEQREGSFPKKKFAFKSRRKAQKESTKSIQPQLKSSLKVNDYLEDKFEIKDKNDETILLKSDEVKGRCISLSNLKNCSISLHGSPGTVYIHQCQSCDLQIGPVSGSGFLEECKDCKISIGCQQLRVHRTTDTTFNVHVTSRSIIEDSTNVKFGPYDLTYDGLATDFKLSGLCEKNNWTEVEDFNWLVKDTKSPNWSLIDQ